MKRKQVFSDESNDPSHQRPAKRSRTRAATSQTLNKEQLDFVAKARENCSVRLSVPSKWRNNKELFRILIAIQPDYLSCALASVRNDSSLLQYVLDKEPDFLYRRPNTFKKVLRINDAIVQYALQRHGRTLEYVVLYRNTDVIPREWLDMALSNDLRAIVHVPHMYRCGIHAEHDQWYNTWFCKCFEKHPDLFYMASPDLRNDPTLVERALKYNLRQNVNHVGGGLMRDKSFVLDMIRKHQFMELYRHLARDNPLRNDQDVQMAMIQADPHLLCKIREPASMDIIHEAVKQSGVALISQYNYLRKCTDITRVYDLVRLAIHNQFRAHRYTLPYMDPMFEHLRVPRLVFWHGRPYIMANEDAWIAVHILCHKPRPISIANTLYGGRDSYCELMTPLAFYHKVYNPDAMPPMQDMMQLIHEAIQMDPRAVHYIPNYLYEDHMDQVIALLCQHARSLALLYPNWQRDITHHLHLSINYTNTKSYLKDMQEVRMHVPHFVQQIILETSCSRTVRYHTYRCLVFALSTCNGIPRLAPHYASTFKDVTFVIQ